jgi:hypothetical protein
MLLLRSIFFGRYQVVVRLMDRVLQALLLLDEIHLSQKLTSYVLVSPFTI